LELFGKESRRDRFRRITCRLLAGNFRRAAIPVFGNVATFVAKRRTHSIVDTNNDDQLLAGLAQP
jgi:hypothetical protein